MQIAQWWCTFGWIWRSQVHLYFDRRHIMSFQADMLRRVHIVRRGRAASGYGDECGGDDEDVLLRYDVETAREREYPMSLLECK